jgi:tetratricopeptide (TPR) repeat protein
VGNPEFVRNELNSAVTGHVVQAGVIHDGVHFHLAERRHVVPRQLPMAVRQFAGRRAELDLLTEISRQADTGAAVMVAAISGTGGIGKTTLAVHWAHSAEDRYSDGQLYVNLRGFDPTEDPVAPATALRGFLDALAVGPGRIPDTLAGQVALYRSLLAGRRMVIVLDNARDADQVRPLLPGSASCLVLVTSRSNLTGLVAQEGARPVALDVLTDDEARELLRQHLGAERVAAPATTDLIEFCVRLPLALSIVAAQAATNPRFGLADLLDELREERRRLDAFESGDSSVRAVFSWSYRAVTPDAARLFRLLGLHLGPDIGLRTAAALAGGHARHLLAELARAHLVDQHVPGRYRMHDLVRAYAAELVDDEEPDAERVAALHRMLDFLLHTSLSAAVALNPNRDPMDLPPSVTPFEPIADTAAGFRWFGAESATLLATARYAVHSVLPRYSWLIPWCLTNFLYRRGRWSEWAAVHEIALATADALGDGYAQARTHRLLGNAYALLGRPAGRTEHETALTMFTNMGDNHGLARTHHARAWADERLGHHADAISHAERALELYRGYHNLSGEAHALDAAGWFYAQLGDFAPALDRCGRALVLHRQLGDQPGVADALDSLGYIHHHLGDPDQSFEDYRQSIELWRAQGAAYDEAITLIRLGEAQDAYGNLGAATETWRRALEILAQLDHQDADALRIRVSDAELALRAAK